MFPSLRGCGGSHAHEEGTNRSAQRLYKVPCRRRTSYDDLHDPISTRGLGWLNGNGQTPFHRLIEILK